jgi:hypothetical protein
LLFQLTGNTLIDILKNDKQPKLGSNKCELSNDKFTKPEEWANLNDKSHTMDVVDAKNWMIF